MQASSNVRICADATESAAEMIRLLRSARNVVYFSSFLCQLDEPLSGGNGVTLAMLFGELGERGVKLRMLYNPEAAYGNLAPTEFLARLPPTADLRCVYGSGELPKIARVVGDNTRYSNHHQKYMCVDGDRLMLGGIDVNWERKGWLQPNVNKPPYCWHEVSVSVPCTDAMWYFVKQNFDVIVESPPFPLTRGLQEYRVLYRLIREARSCVHMEAQTCISAGSTANDVFEAVAQRVAKAHHTPGDRFRFMLLTNMIQIDESKPISWITTQEVHWSRRFLRKRTSQLGVPAEALANRVFIGVLEDETGRHVKVHSNLLIQDGRRMLRTSSNLTDRSMSAFPCDNELGIVLEGEAVAELQQKLWRRYFLQSNLFTPETAFDNMKAETGLVRRATFRGRKMDVTVVPDVLVNVLMDLLHLGPWFGGKKAIHWTVTPVQTT
jgi:phosphatidylserine/phosphatidylglycerophosphate/cardiolipin synthase-like enzyme